MLNLIKWHGTGGTPFRWVRSLTGAKRDAIHRWARANDTLSGGRGTDPHGWRNALNYYGWGSAALQYGQRVYEDRAFITYRGAMREAVRAMIRTRKPTGMLGWRGRHAQLITGYYGLVGDPFKKNADGSWANDFTVAGFYVTDPLRSSNIVNRRVTYTGLLSTTNYRLRFQKFYEQDSPYDDVYTPGQRRSRDEWYGKYVLILPQR